MINKSLPILSPNFLDGFGNPKWSELVVFNQQVKNVLYMLNDNGAGYEELEERHSVTEIDADYNISRTDRIISCKQTGALELTLPLTAKLAIGDWFLIVDTDNQALTNNITLLVNGNTVNTIGTDIVLNKDGSYLSIIYLGSGKFLNTNSILLNSDNLWTGTNDFDSIDTQTINPSGALSIGADDSGNTVVNIGNSANTGSTAAINFHFGIGSSQTYNTQLIAYANEKMALFNASKFLIDFGDAYTSFNNPIYPATDNAFTLGSALLRFTDIYATNGTINTSDENLKDNVNPSELGLDFLMSLKPKSYKWKDQPAFTKKELKLIETKNKKGEVAYIVKEMLTEQPEQKFKRLHRGLLVQDVLSSMKEFNISTNNFGGYVFDPIAKRGGLRYDQFIPVTITSIQEQQGIIKDLKIEIKNLKTQSQDQQSQIDDLKAMVQSLIERA